MAAIFGPGQNMADTFCPGGQNVAARFSPTLQYMVRARTIRGRSFSPGVADRTWQLDLVLPVPCNMVGARTIILCSSVRCMKPGGYYHSTVNRQLDSMYIPPCFSFYSFSMSLWVYCFIIL